MKNHGRESRKLSFAHQTVGYSALAFWVARVVIGKESDPKSLEH